MISINGLTRLPAWLAGLRTATRRAWRQIPPNFVSLFLPGTVLTAALVGLLVASPHLPAGGDHYAVGDFATRTIRAPWDLSIPNPEATERLRAETAAAVAPVATFDATLATTLATRISTVFDRAREMALAEDLALGSRPLVAHGEGPAAGNGSPDAARVHERLARDMVAALESELGIVSNPGERVLLAAGLFDREVEDALLALLAEAYARPVAGDRRLLQEVADRSRRPGEPPQIVLRSSGGAGERSMPDAAGLDDVEGATKRMRARAPFIAPDLGAAERDLLVDLVARLVRPNTAFDTGGTAERRARAAEAVLPVSVTFRRDQLIVSEGGEITPTVRLALDHLQQQGGRAPFLRHAAGASLLTAALLVAFLWVPVLVNRVAFSSRQVLFALAFVAATTLTFWAWQVVSDAVAAQVRGGRQALVLLYPASAGAILAALVVPLRLGIALAVVSSMALGLIADLGLVFGAHALAVSLVGAHLASRCRSRSCVLRAGLGSGCAGLVTGAGVLAFAGTDGGWVSLVTALAAAFVGAASGALAALALGGLVEWAFGFSSRLRLVELLSYDHPLLRELMNRAPGTFQHSVSVALLAGTGANEIGADALLVRVGALYHDVGKIEAPEWFTENQHGRNPHDDMPPEESARIIRDHVARGLDLLKKFRVGDAVADFVREHHGTSEMTFFARKAQAAGVAIDPNDYRYRGPRPRSREAALLLIADRIEATARSVGPAPPDRLPRLVEQALDAVQADGQLDDSALTLRDLSALRPALAAALQGLHHTRVAYPAPA